MSSRIRSAILIGAGVLLGLMAAAWIAFPPHPIAPWIVGMFTTLPAERWWYGLPEGRRSQELYHWVMLAASLMYPALVATAFSIWCWPLRSGEPLFPRRSVWLAAIGGLGSSAWYLKGWSWGVQYQGEDTIRTYLVLTVLYLAGLWRLWVSARKTGSWWGSLAWHFGLCLWLLGFAFPWLGEPCC